ncbi:MAG: hypothetical protein QF473_29960 [Planctomycetota bacterium]|nr:hypothetical protein [Planctomycetota bacterium]
MARIITKQLAKKICKKLDAKIVKGIGSHDTAEVYEDGVLIVQFGMRRGSEKDLGHDHIPADIFVGPSFAKLLGQCPRSRKEWIKKIREDGWID